MIRRYLAFPPARRSKLCLLAWLAAVFTLQASAADPPPTVANVDLAPDYGYAVVGAPDCRYGWILARTAVLPPVTRSAINERLKALGYDPARFENTVDPPVR